MGLTQLCSVRYFVTSLAAIVIPFRYMLYSTYLATDLRICLPQKGFSAMNLRKVHWLSRTTLVAFLALSLASCATTRINKTVSTPLPTPTTPATKGAASITAYLDGLDAQGSLTGSILVAQHGSIILSRGFGLADEAQHLPNTPTTRFRIGSVTKQFTAMAILILQDRGKINVQDGLCKYIDQCPAAWAPVTVQDLLIHASGIPDFIGFGDFPSVIGQAATVAQLIARFKGLPLNFVPGSQWSYSNSGYVLLGYLIERLSGMSFADFVQTAILDPLDLHDTGYDSNSPALPQHATGYLSPGVKPVFLDMSEFYAAGAMYSTVGDLFRWDQAIQHGQLVASADLQAMFTPHIPCPSAALSTTIGYGYGWFIADEAGQRLNYHWGRIDGFRSSNGIYPQADIDVIFLSNLESVDTFGIAHQLGTLLVNHG